MAENRNGRTRCCSFCGRGEGEVELLFPAMDGKSYICDVCVSVCSDYIDENLSPLSETTDNDIEKLTYKTLPRPMEIRRCWTSTL